MLAVSVLAAGAFLSNIFLAIFIFLIANVGAAVTGIRLVAYIYFRFFVYKNRNAKVAMPAVGTFLSNIFLAILALLIANIKVTALGMSS